MAANYANAENKAEEILKEFRVTEPIVPIYNIAEAKGVEIKLVSMPEGIQNAAGFLDQDNRVVYVNSEDAPNRQTFTIAHELGHLLLGHQPTEYKVLMRFPELNGKTEVEQEANCFAANLLVPMPMLKSVMKEYDLTKEHSGLLAQIFGVSKAVINFRLNRI